MGESQPNHHAYLGKKNPGKRITRAMVNQSRGTPPAFLFCGPADFFPGAAGDVPRHHDSEQRQDVGGRAFIQAPNPAVNAVAASGLKIDSTPMGIDQSSST